MRHRHIAMLVLALTTGTAFAHSDFIKEENFENVRVSITTGFDYEEVNKVFLFGELAEQLAKQLNYTNPILLDFTHMYGRTNDRHYFISYGKGRSARVWDDKDEHSTRDWLKEDTIYIRLYANQFDAETTLKLLEYAIMNFKRIKSSQKEIVLKRFGEYYPHDIFDSINTNLIKKVLGSPNSDRVNNVLNLEIVRPLVERGSGYSYFLQNNQYTVCRGSDTTKNLITLNNIYDFKRVKNYANSRSVMVFDTDHSFYFISEWGDKISKRHIIQDVDELDCTPFVVTHIGGDKLAISWQPAMIQSKRTLIYVIDKDILIQDLGDLIEKSGML